MPLLSEMGTEYGGYGFVVEQTFKNLIKDIDVSIGGISGLLIKGLAVIYDKNKMEASGYAAVISDIMKETVHLAEYYENDPIPPVKWEDGWMYIRAKDSGNKYNAFKLQSG